MQRLDGVYSVLRLPWVYSAAMKAIARQDARRLLVERYIQPKARDRVIDIGCGPGSMLEFLGDVNYTGVDLDPAYIANARRRYGSAGEFVCGPAEQAADRITGTADIVLGVALLHHLDDAQAEGFFQAAAKMLKSGGRVVTLDCVYLESQNPISRLLIAMDRGKNTRRREQYAALAKGSFQQVESYLHQDLMRVPYDHCIMVCSGQKS